MKVSVVNSAGGSFCWNYETDIFYSNYAGASICCNYALRSSIAIVLVVLSATFILVNLFVALMQVTLSVEIM